MTAKIPRPTGGRSWYSFETQQTIPSSCGSGAMLYDVLADDGSGRVLLQDRVPPLDLSGVEVVDLKIRVKMKTADSTKTPSLDWIKVYAK